MSVLREMVNVNGSGGARMNCDEIAKQLMRLSKDLDKVQFTLFNLSKELQRAKIRNDCK